LAAHVPAEAITENSVLSEPVDLLFIGDGIYAAKMSKKTKAFIDRLDSRLVKNAAVFGTYGGQDKAIVAMAARLTEKNIHVCTEKFACKGQSWFFANRNHPNQADLDSAMEFGENIIRQISDR
jgi:Uncharacterized flavoproteins